MPINGYLKIPDIDGEATAATHEGEIEVHGFEWSISRAGASPTGRFQSRAVVSPITFHKFVDASSVYLALEAVNGRSFDEIVFTVRKNVDDGGLDYLTITMTNCVIMGFVESHESHDGDDQLIHETLVLAFEEIKLTYLEQTGDDSATEHESEFEATGGRSKQLTRVGRPIPPPV